MANIRVRRKRLLPVTSQPFELRGQYGISRHEREKAATLDLAYSSSRSVHQLNYIGNKQGSQLGGRECKSQYLLHRYTAYVEIKSLHFLHGRLFLVGLILLLSLLWKPIEHKID